MKRILLHCCCGPCAVYPISQLTKEFEITAFFHNHNIHPYKEFNKRLSTLETYIKNIGIPLIVHREYELTEFLREAVFHETTRCSLCYEYRLQKTAERAAKENYSAFTTTLLYSKYQNHNQIIDIGKRLAEQNGILFYYQDFREGWQLGIDESIEREMYRQPYCGCIYSEQERYDKRFKKRNE